MFIYNNLTEEYLDMPWNRLPTEIIKLYKLNPEELPSTASITLKNSDFQRVKINVIKGDQ